MNKNLNIRSLWYFTVSACFMIVHASAQTTCTISVNQAQTINPSAQKLLGVSFDARASADYNAGAPVDPVGYFDPADGSLLPAAVSAWSRLPVNGVRYPGNPVVYNWNWSYTIGPFADRIAQPMGPNGSNSQALRFGFDEFMDSVTLGKGLPAQDVQIMVNIYPSVGQSNAATLAADWVEYCNQPHNNSNPRGGTNWAMLRDSFGHPAPYGIRIWNIGNEPWSPNELGSTSAGANAFIALAIPIIDSMRAVDPSIQITVPAVGNSSSAWNSTLLASTSLMSRIYGFSPHAFYDEDTGTNNPSISQVGALLTNLATVAAANGKKIVLGDQAHQAPNNDPDKAMRCEGALATADLLLMISQISNLELANFWIYGNVKAVWHPIRENADGSYTFMAAAQIYEKFNTVFYDNSLSTTLANASDGGPVANSRAAAFKSNDQTKAGIVVINTHLSADNEIIPPVLAGFTLQSVQLLSAPSLAFDTFYTTIQTPLSNGNYALPHAAILIFQYQSTPLSVEFIEPIHARVEKDRIRVEWTTATEANSSHFEVERSTADGLHFEKIGQINAAGNSTNRHSYHVFDAAPKPGLNYYRIRQIDLNGESQLSKIVSASFQTFDVSIFPNPGKDLLRFESSEPIEKISVVDFGGKLMLSLENAPDSLDISGLPKGVYFLKIQGNNGQIILKKLIRQ